MMNVLDLFRLDGRVAMVTGGSKGIGRAICRRFAVEKVKIIIIHYDPDERDADKTLRILADTGVNAESHRCDVSDYGAVKEFFEDILSRFGRVDVLVNNAGITQDTLLMRMTEEAWDRVIKVNLKSVFNCSHAVVP